MAKQFSEISTDLMAFIKKQPLYFVGTAGAEGRVNVSPKGMDSFRVLGPNRVIWLNMTGSGNETSAHVQENGRMTVMFCAFEGPANILRLYGNARVIHHSDAGWSELLANFPPNVGARQIFDLEVDLVQTSCGYAVPFMDYKSERETLKKWAKNKGEDGIQSYWVEKNQTTIDGVETHIVKLNGIPQ